MQVRSPVFKMGMPTLHIISPLFQTINIVYMKAAGQKQESDLVSMKVTFRYKSS